MHIHCAFVCVSLKGPVCKYSCLPLIPDKKGNQIKPEAKLASPQKIFPPALIAPLCLTGIILMGIHPSSRLTVPEWVNAAVSRGKRWRACWVVGREAILLPPPCLLAASHGAFGFPDAQSSSLSNAAMSQRIRSSLPASSSCVI